MNILMLFGGRSSEHFVSNRSAYEILQVLKKQGHQVAKLGITQAGDFLPLFGEDDDVLLSKTWEKEAVERLECMPGKNADVLKAPYSLQAYIYQLIAPSGLSQIDLVFPIIHGNMGEDGVLQGFLEMLDLPYVGCRLGASYLGMDKIMAKRLWKQAGIPVVPWQQCTKVDYQALSSTEKQVLHQNLQQELGISYFVKPLQGGSSLGANRVIDYTSFLLAMEICFQYDEVALIEPYLECRELEIGLLGQGKEVKTSAVVEIIKQDDTFYDYEAKYGQDSTAEVVFQADLSDEEKKQIEQFGRLAFTTLGCTQLSRVDFFLDKKTQKLYINELNTLPGFTKTSGYARAFEQTGIAYESILEHLMDYALEAHHEKHSLTRSAK